jgi:hypothetical protein
MAGPEDSFDMQMFTNVFNILRVLRSRIVKGQEYEVRDLCE